LKTITIFAGCFNESENIEEFVGRVRSAMEQLPQYQHEIIIIDNASTDGTQEILRRFAAEDQRIKVIFNMRNFGPVRSGYHGLLQARGDAVVAMASDLQDPPEMIPQFVAKWEEGYRLALAVKNESQESRLMFLIRKLYYELISKLSHVRLLKNATGFGLYDQEVIELFRRLDDPYPYVRGIISDFGFPVAEIPFVQPARKRGITKNNFYSLYDIAMLGITSFSKVPLRLATMIGFGMSLLSLVTALGYLAYKLLFWNSFPVGQAPIVIGLFLFSSIQLFFIGIVGEYIGAIHTQVLRRPLVVEKERINF
jgi:glycosyltransferase involved in cell wall biosynthesis